MIGTVFACGGTLAAFLLAREAARLRPHPLANPILLAAVLVWAVLAVTRTPVEAYLAAASPLRAALMTAIVALGALIHARAAELRSHARPVLVAIGGGSLVGILTGALGARALGLDRQLVEAMAAKSVTSPFAIALMAELGGPPALAAGLVLATGIVGAVLLPPVLRLLGVTDPAARGLAIGQAAHVVGTDQLARVEPAAAPYAGLAMVLAGLATALMLPLLWRWLLP